MQEKKYDELIYFKENIVSENKYDKRVITVKSMWHRGSKRYMLSFHYDIELIDIVKQIKGIRYSGTNKAWYIDDNPENLQLIFKTIKAHAYIDISAIFDSSRQTENEADESWFINAYKPKPAFFANLISDQVKQELDSFRSWMLQMRYSESTINTYCDSLSVFFRYFHDKPIEEITNNDLMRFNANYIIENKLSASYQNQIISAIRIFYEKKKNILFDVAELERPKRYRKLPKVIAKPDVEKMLKSIKNTKHMIALMMIYACGMRRSELINLTIDDISFQRKVLSIINAKGQKDRIIPLSDKLLNLIKKYYDLYRPKKYFIEGQIEGSQYSATSLIVIFHKYMDSVLPGNNFTLHCLRHSYATHLLESGTDLRYIQTLLGHKSSKTTEIYTWVSMKSLHNIKNPTDDFDL